MPKARPILLVSRAATWIAAAVAVASCTSQPAEQERAPTETNMAPVVRVDPAIDRAELLALIAKAASAAASGADDLAEQRRLDGRQFEVRIRFGCGGPAALLRDEALGWAIDPGGKTLRVRAAPTILAADERVAELVPGEFEAVEGFWIPRPWMLDAGCPKAPPPQPAEPGGSEPGAAEDPPPPPAPGQRIGIAQFFTAADTRTARRSARAYEAVNPLDDNEAQPTAGLGLVLSGRLRSLPGGRVVHCGNASPDQAPDCIVSVDLDRVRIEQPGIGETIAEWGGG